jgi:hypothetical protein
MQYNRFDLWGGELSPEKGEECDNSNNECKGMIS